MFTNFHNVSFISSDVSGLEVEGKSLFIQTFNNKSFEVKFNTPEDAHNGLRELTVILNGGNTKPSSVESKADEVLQSAKSVFDSLQGSFGTLRDKLTSKVTDIALEAMIKGSPVSELFSRKDELINAAHELSKMFTHSSTDTEATPPVAEPSKPDTKPEPVREVQPCFNDVLDSIFTAGPAAKKTQVNVTKVAKKLSSEEFKQVFGTPDEPLVGDFLDPQLKEFIADFVDGALANERVQSLFSSIKEQFGEAEAEAAIESYKTLIYTFCVQNTEMTLSGIIQQFFS